MTSMYPVSLDDLLHGVPRLWDFIDSGSLKILLGTSSGVRRIAQDHVTHVSFPGGWKSSDVCALVTGRWLQL